VRALFVIPAYEPAWHLGGVVRSQSLLYRALNSLGVDVTVFTTDSGVDRRLDVPVNQPVDLGGVRVFYFRADWSLSYFYSRSLARACKDTLRDYDILHVVSVWCFPGLVASIQARRQGVPYVMAPHGSLLSYCSHQQPVMKRLYTRFLEYPAFQNASAIRYTSGPERDVCSTLGWRPPSFVLPNGLDLSQFDNLPSREQALQCLGLPSSSLIVGYLGRLHPRKALDTLVLAFAEVTKTIPDAYLVLAGPDGGHEATLRSLVHGLGLEGKVLFLGFVEGDRRNALLASQSVSVLVSHPGDNFGMGIAESMAAGVPVLVSDHVGIGPDIRADGAGRVVPVDPQAVARQLTQLLSDPVALQEMGSKARSSALRRYDVKSVARGMLTAFEDVLSGRRSSGLGWSALR
jgi:glycosyltransferase involved in cell wall biosynthesis